MALFVTYLARDSVT